MSSAQIGNITPAELTDTLGGMTIQGVYKALRSLQIPTEATSTRRKLIPAIGIRKLFEERGFVYPKQNLSFQIVKGGTGKTSLSYSLAIRAYQYGARILCIDFDQQGNLTRSFNVEARDRPVWLNIFRDRLSTSEAVVEITDNLHLIPSNLNNSRLDVELTGSVSNLRDMICDKLAPIRNNYDFVIMDCPPAINKINTAATCASDLIIIPINPDPYAMDGLEFTITELDRIKEDFKLNFDYRIVWNRHDARERLGMFYIHELAKRADRSDKVLPFVIRTDSSVKNAIFDSKSIFDLNRKSVVRGDVDQFAKEILGINAWRDTRNQGQA
ncbi:MAG: AAA family ATPase [Bdellovibrionia bacterium]